jgi:DNA-binding CsgD family transcriptional regulator
LQPRDRLTAKEIHVATLVWQGLTNEEIVGVLPTNEQVVKNYLRAAFDKLGVSTRRELALLGGRPRRGELAYASGQWAVAPGGQGGAWTRHINFRAAQQRKALRKRIGGATGVSPVLPSGGAGRSAGVLHHWIFHAR